MPTNKPISIPRSRFVPVASLLIGILLLGACVPNRKIQMLQKDDVNATQLPIDSTLRDYDLKAFDYKIQPNDVLFIRFNSLTPDKYDFLSSGSGAAVIQATGGGGGANAQLLGDMIDEEGELALPVLGKIKVAGLTVFEIQEKLQGLANQYLDSPVVKVRLVNFRVTILGEVENEGTVILTNNRVTLLEAIAQGGGLGELADRAHVKLIRQKNGITEVQYINLLDENFFNSPYYYANQNDILIVPPLRQRPFRKYFGENLALVLSTISLLLLTYNIIQN